MQKYLIIGLVVLGLISALGVAGKIIYEQGQSIANLNTAIKSEKEAREEIQKNISEQNKKVDSYSKEVKEISKERKDIQAKAIDHSSRVTKIALEKPTLYEKLVNKDFQNTQEELRGLMK